MVFAVKDYSYPNYGVFEVPPDGQFPVPHDKSIIMTKTKVERAGTFVQLYCSHRYKDYDMIGKISDKLVDITEDAVRKFETPIETSYRCHAEILKYQENPRGNRKLWLSRPHQRWSKHKYNYCTPKVLANMAFQGQLVIEGNLKNFVPPGGTSSLEIMFDEKITLAQIFYQEQVFKGVDDGKQIRALAWYQGHLHIFQRTSRGDWMPYTRLGVERLNGDLIYKHLYQSSQIFSETEVLLAGYLKRARGEYFIRNPMADEWEFNKYLDSRKKFLEENLKDKNIGTLRSSYDGAYVSGKPPKRGASKEHRIHIVPRIELYAPRLNTVPRI